MIFAMLLQNRASSSLLFYNRLFPRTYIPKPNFVRTFDMVTVLKPGADPRIHPPTNE